MASVQGQGVNGVSYGQVYTVTAQDATDGFVQFDFDARERIVAIIRVYTSAGIPVDMSDAVITYSADGKSIRIADGAATYNTTATNRIDIVAQPRV